MTDTIDYALFNARVAFRQSGPTLKWLGAFMLVVSISNAILPPAPDVFVVAGNLIVGSLLVADGFALSRHRDRPQRVPWEFAAMITLAVLWFLAIYVVWEPITANLIYVIVAMAAFGPLTFAARPFIAASFIMLAAGGTALILANEPRFSDWFIGMAAALAVSAITLRLRLQLLHESADDERAIEELSSRDPLTSLLNRRGVIERVPLLEAEARRLGEPWSVYFLDIRGMKNANDTYGHELGDTILCDAARAITSAARESDLIGRWGGDEFLVVGIGASDGLGFAERVNALFTEYSVARRASRVGGITVGCSHGTGPASDFEFMTKEADQDMYRHRRPAQL